MSVPELRIVVPMEGTPRFEVSATSDDLPRLLDWIATPEAARELRAVARSLAVIAGLAVASDDNAPPPDRDL